MGGQTALTAHLSTEDGADAGHGAKARSQVALGGEGADVWGLEEGMT